MISEKRRPNITGELTELYVMSALTELGWHVCRPVSDYCHIDIVGIDDKYNMYKIQVKTAKKTNKGFKLTLTKPSNNEAYEAYEVDYFATVFEGKLYMVPFSVVNNKKSCSFKLGESEDFSASTFEFPSFDEKL